MDNPQFYMRTVSTPYVRFVVDQNTVVDREVSADDKIQWPSQWAGFLDGNGLTESADPHFYMRRSAGSPSVDTPYVRVAVEGGTWVDRAVTDADKQQWPGPWEKFLKDSPPVEAAPKTAEPVSKPIGGSATPAFKPVSKPAVGPKPWDSNKGRNR